MTLSSATAPPRSPRRLPGVRWNRTSLVVAVTAFACVLVAAIFVPPYLSLDPGSSRVALRPDSALHFPAVAIHAATGGIALLTGPLQFSRRLRRRGVWHRWIGRVYLFAGVLPSALSGIVAALLTSSGPVAMAAFLSLDILWIITGLAAYRTARAGRYAAHREWMLRNFSLTFAAVTLRIWLSALVAIQLPWLDSLYGGDFDQLFATAYAVSHWTSWLPNLLLVEVYLARQAARQAREALVTALQTTAAAADNTETSPTPA